MIPDAEALALEGMKLDAAGAESLEARVQVEPGDVGARLRLLGYLSRAHLSSPDLARLRATHIVWFIENEPRHVIVGTPFAAIHDREDPAFAEAKSAWATHLAKPSPDPELLFHAARFFTLSDPAKSQMLLEQGERLDPQSPRWARELGTLIFRSVTVELGIAISDIDHEGGPLDAEACRREAANALGHFERALALCKDDARRFSNLSNAVDAALEANENDEARMFADEILRLAPLQTANRHQLDYIHKAHIALGRVALTEGDVARAIDELLAAGKIGSANAPVLRSFGPDFSLANRLYERGETAPVLAYLDECARFWSPKRIAFWREQIERGEKARLHRGYDPDLP